MRSSARAVARAKSRRVGAGLSCSLVACCSSAPTSSPHTEELFRERLRDTVDRFLRAEDTKGVNQANIICKNFLDSLEQVRPADTRRVSGSGEDSVFANNFVDMEEVKVIGFDLDYTLVTYTTELQKFIYEKAKSILLEKFGFPSSLKQCSYDENFAIRGLSVDPENGALLKLSNYQRVGWTSAYIGKRKVDSSELLRFYGPSRHIPIRKLEKLRPLHDKYAFAKACLIADAVDLFERRKLKFGEDYRPTCVVDDVYHAIEIVHQSGAMHDAIVQDMTRFINPTPHLSSLLQSLFAAGKRFFLCTNSGFDYSNRTLSHVLQIPYCSSGMEWRSLFDVVMCSSKKPSFYRDTLPFRQWDVETNAASAKNVKQLDKEQVYVDGCAHALSTSTGWHGKDILYLGDNLQSDLQQARRWHGWHTGCIIEEVGGEVVTQLSMQFQELHLLQSLTHKFLIDIQLAFHSSGVMSNKEHKKLLSELQAAERAINAEMSFCFNEQFGSIFRTDNHPSLFAVSARKYADLYMKDVSSLRNFNPNHKFYPTQSIHMAHDQTHTHLAMPPISNDMMKDK